MWVVFGVGLLGAGGQDGYAGVGWRHAVPCSGRAAAGRHPTVSPALVKTGLP